jgi:hypothetical protein
MNQLPWTVAVRDGEPRLLDQGASGTREQHLAAMAGGRDACHAVHVEAHVAVASGLTLARVHAHPHAHALPVRPGFLSQPTLGRDRRGDRLAGGTEDREEGVALGADLHPSVRHQRLAKDGSVAFEHLSILLAQGLKEARRAVNVGEQEGDGADREVVVHHSILRRRPYVIQHLWADLNGGGNQTKGLPKGLSATASGQLGPKLSTNRSDRSVLVPHTGFWAE